MSNKIEWIKAEDDLCGTIFYIKDKVFDIEDKGKVTVNWFIEDLLNEDNNE